jgi:hypothetical protein
MRIIEKISASLRGEISPWAVLLEAGRRVGTAIPRLGEPAKLGTRAKAGQPAVASFGASFRLMNDAELLRHFRERAGPRFFGGLEATSCNDSIALRERLLEKANEILRHRWPLLGVGILEFGAEVNWLCDPASGVRWPLEYHGDIKLVRGDGSDVRVLWELNRLGHLLTLGQAYAVAGDERFAEEVFSQIDSWREQNPDLYGPNWTCAIEVALRAMNLLAAFHLFRHSHALNERRLVTTLGLFDEHGRYIRRHLEFSYIATGNHYLADVTGLLWLGIYLPELREAKAWRAFGLRELLREMDKQVLADGADSEASTGYHRFVTELFLYSFVLCRANGIEIEARYWQRLRSMLDYIRVYLRPDGRAPLIGDADGSQALSLARREANEHAYLLSIGAVLFDEPQFKIEAEAPTELFWLLGADGVKAYNELQTAGAQAVRSAVFEQAGTCVLRDRDLYLLLSANGAGLRGRGAHGHNDALSVEVSACGISFLSDPGSCVYTGGLHARHAFRSTAYHSTVQVDGVEQNEITPSTPFVMGNQARPRIVRWESNEEQDLAVAEHYGYQALPRGAVTHRRAVTFNKAERYWLIEDTFSGTGTHDFRFVFHAAPERQSRLLDEHTIDICDEPSGARLVIASLDSLAEVTLEPRWSSRNYGSKTESIAACWKLRRELPIVTRWLLLPIAAGEDETSRLELIERLRTS